jgi:hypothetical protein
MTQATPLGSGNAIGAAVVELLDADPAALSRTFGNATMEYLSANLVAAEDVPAAMAKIEAGIMVGLLLGDGKILIPKKRASWLQGLTEAGRPAHQPERR